MVDRLDLERSMKANYSMMANIARGFSSICAEVDDIVQDAMVGALKVFEARPHRFASDAETRKVYAGCARNAGLNYVRNSARQMRLDALAHSESEEHGGPVCQAVELAEERAMQTDIVQSWAEVLPPTQRAAVDLTLQGLTEKGVARELGISTGAAYKRIVRATQRLSSIYEQ